MSCAKEKLLQPPGWNPEVEKYIDWRYKVELWDKACQMSKVKQNERGYRLYDQLKDVTKHSVGEKILCAIQVGEIDVFGEDGVNQILQTLDKCFKADDLVQLHNSWRSFISLKKKGDDSIEDFIIQFDKSVIELKRDGIALPQEIYAMQLVDAVNIPDKEVKIILTGIDYNKKEEMFTDAKRSLRKFLGKEFVKKDSMNEREEVNAGEEVLYSKQFGGRKSYEGYRRGRWNTKPDNYARGTGRGIESWRSRGNRVSSSRVSGMKRRQLNPVDENGEVQTCKICKSIYHFAGFKGQNCPESYENKEKVFQCEENEEEGYKCDVNIEVSEVFLMEENDEALLDSCCSANVMGKKWKERYINGLCEEDISEVKEEESMKTFKFGGEKAVKSLERVEFPCVLFGKKTTIVADVVDREIPLLISKPEMKRRGFRINFNDDTLEVGNMKYELMTTRSGHFKVPLSKQEEVNLIMEDKSYEDKVKVITKLHRQFGHYQAKGLKDLIRNSGEVDSEVNTIIEKVVEECETCLRYKKTPARPVVSPPLSVKWNDTIAMDLKKIENGYFLHIIDLFTRFCRARFIKNKTPQSVVDAFILSWISLGFGAPNKVLVDNGGEFDNPDYLEAMHAYNIEICTTGAGSPWSNGICERNHQVVDVMVQKMKEDFPNMNINLALSHAVSAKNCLQNHNGFTPVQLVTGTLPNLPSVLQNSLPALEEVDENSSCKKHLDAMYVARSAFLKAESSERIKRALRHPIRSTEKFYERGEKVFYKRDDSNRWRGPGRVFGQKGTVCFIWHGSRLVKASICRMVKVKESRSVSEGKNGNSGNGECVRSIENMEDNTADDGIGDEELHKIICHEELRQEGLREKGKSDDGLGEVNETPGAENDLKHEGKSIRIRKKVRTYIPEDGKWKDTSDNVENETEEANIVFIPKARHCEPEVVKAKLAEIDNWIKMEAVDTVEDKGQKTMSTRWVIVEKENSEGQMFPKARFVLRGFEEAEDHVQSDAPTAAKSSLRLALAIAANEDWENFETLDVKAAFLQGRKIEREIYLKPPEELKIEGKLWKLRKTAYGLIDAARAWYLSIREELINLGCKLSGVDRALFRWYSKNIVLCGLILLHVDDIISCGTKEFKGQVIDNILGKFEFGKQSAMCFKYVGIEMEKEEEGIRIHQAAYVSEITEVKFCKNGRAGHESLSTDENKELKALAGQIMWAAGQSRPDASFDSLELSMERNKATVNTLNRANKTVRKLRNVDSGIFYPKLGSIETLRIMVYGDASFGNLPDGVSSAQGCIVLLTGNRFAFSPLDWSSKKIRRKVSSTLEAETIAIRDSISSGIYFGHLLSEIYYDDLQKNHFPVYVYTDSKSLEQCVRSSKLVQEKKLRIDIAEIQRCIEEKEITDLRYVKTDEQYADGLTKRDVCMERIMSIFNGDSVQ